MSMFSELLGPRSADDIYNVPRKARHHDDEPALASETQIGGDHYCHLAIQPMQYSMANNLDPLQHTIIKYVTRFRDKGGVLDLEKARHCIDLLIEWERDNS